MKKSLIALMASALFISSVVAGDYETYEEPEYKTAIIDSSLDFEAEREGYEVELEWDEYKGDDFQYYKIMRSETHSNPIYPDQDALNYIDNVSNTKYRLKDWAQKTVNYRVCVITTDNGRICSEVVKLEGYENEKKEYEEDKNVNCIQVIQPAYNYETGVCKNFSTPCNVPSGWKKVKSCETKNTDKQTIYEDKKVVVKEKIQTAKKVTLEAKLTSRADTMVDNLVSRLEKKYISDTDKQADRLETIIDKLETLNAKVKSDKTKALITYIIDGLQEALDAMTASDDIEQIFNILEDE